MPRKLNVGGLNPKDYGVRCKSCGKMASPRHWLYYRVGDKNIELCNKCFDQLTKSPGRTPVRHLDLVRKGQQELWPEQ